MQVSELIPSMSIRGLLVAIVLVGALGASDPAVWPGESPVPLDQAGVLGVNVSGLHLSSTTTMWAVRDAPSTMLRLERTDVGWEPMDGWGDGRPLRYRDGDGSPDAEAVTVGAHDGVVYVGAERNNASSSVSRNTILRYDTLGSGDLVPMQQWDIAAVVAPSGPNTGIEGLAWIAAETLTALGSVRLIT